jgi:hypothetical protein
LNFSVFECAKGHLIINVHQPVTSSKWCFRSITDKAKLARLPSAVMLSFNFSASSSQVQYRNSQTFNFKNLPAHGSPVLWWLIMVPVVHNFSPLGLAVAVCIGFFKFRLCV